MTPRNNIIAAAALLTAAGIFSAVTADAAMNGRWLNGTDASGLNMSNLTVREVTLPPTK